MKFSRRRILTNLGLGAAALPLLESRRLLAQSASASPKRLVVMVIGNGTLADRYWPKDKRAERDFAWGEILSPLDDATRRHGSLKPDLNLVGGIEYRSALDDERENKIPAGNSHNTPCHMLTGSRVLQCEKLDHLVANSMSVDQMIANALAKTAPTKFKSLHFGLPRIGDPFQVDVSYNGKAISTKGKGTPDVNAAELDPLKNYQKLFADIGANPAQLALARARKKSLLDSAGKDLESIGKNLGAEDRQKIEVHLASIRQIEKQIDTTTMGCSPPPAPMGRFNIFPLSADAQVQGQDQTKLHLDMMAAALACDLSRVVTFTFPDSGGSAFSFPWLGDEFMKPATEFYSKYINYHQIAHHSYNPTMAPLRVRAERWFHEMFAYFLEALKDRKEGNGTVLDNSVVVLMNTGSNGASHGISGVPIIMAGGCGGYYKTGRYIKLGDWGTSSYDKANKYVPHNGLLVSLANAMGVPTETYGDPRYGGELTQLRG